MTDIVIKEHTAYYTVFDHQMKKCEYYKDSIEDMTFFVQFLIDELYKANAKKRMFL